MHTFFDPELDEGTSSFVLNEEESSHACRVLRLKVGDPILLLNGNGIGFNALIKEAHPKKCMVEILGSFGQDKNRNAFHVHIAIAPTKNSERLDWFIEKATEIGVDEISFLNCENNERKSIKLDRIRRIAIAAMKQSQRLYLPKLNELQSFHSFISNYPKGMLAYCGEGDKVTISNCFSGNMPILIGPEGDFSEKEKEYALANDYKLITLGENRLRTETAGLYACMEAVLKTTT
jgi:16S rRNA (uracil1498-N3)-methyltransferase